ncbi:hypothetical protein CTI14_44200, partial [Methylobacterium radiotolerans]
MLIHDTAGRVTTLCLDLDTSKATKAVVDNDAPERHPDADSRVGVSATPALSAPVTPEQAWALAPLIAGQPAYRTGRWVRGKFQYPGTPHKLSAMPPRAPAAVLIHDTAGRVTTLCLDLDTSKATKAVVDNDA